MPPFQRNINSMPQNQYYNIIIFSLNYLNITIFVY